MQSALKMRLEVDAQTASVLDGQSRIANWLYKHLLEEANALRRRFRETQDSEVANVLYTERGSRNRIPTLKQRYSFLRKRGPAAQRSHSGIPEGPPWQVGETGQLAEVPVVEPEVVLVGV